MSRYAIHHRTHYRYVRSVELGPHRLMVRPTDSHDLRLERATLTLSPRAQVRWAHDVFGNSIATVVFDQPTAELLIESDLEVTRYALGDAAIALLPEVATWPFIYAPDDRMNLGPFLICRYNSCGPAVMAWAQEIVKPGADTLQALRDLNAAIRSGFVYNPRFTSGVQTPSETLSLRSGACRDFATLFIEAARALGFGARFVTGYLYDPALESDAAAGIAGAGATHAWVEVYLPGPGWVEFDPTNGLIESPSLLRVGVATDAEHAVPVSGSYTGYPEDVAAVDIEVNVTALSAAPSPAPVESAATPPVQGEVEIEPMQEMPETPDAGRPIARRTAA